MIPKNLSRSSPQPFPPRRQAFHKPLREFCISAIFQTPSAFSPLQSRQQFCKYKHLCRFSFPSGQERSRPTCLSLSLKAPFCRSSLHSRGTFSAVQPFPMPKPRILIYYQPSKNPLSGLISILYPVSRAASLALSPLFPIASES